MTMPAPLYPYPSPYLPVPLPLPLPKKDGGCRTVATATTLYRLLMSLDNGRLEQFEAQEAYKNDSARAGASAAEEDKASLSAGRAATPRSGKCGATIFSTTRCTRAQTGQRYLSINSGGRLRTLYPQPKSNTRKSHAQKSASENSLSHSRICCARRSRK